MSRCKKMSPTVGLYGCARHSASAYIIIIYFCIQLICLHRNALLVSPCSWPLLLPARSPNAAAGRGNASPSSRASMRMRCSTAKHMHRNRHPACASDCGRTAGSRFCCGMSEQSGDTASLLVCEISLDGGVDGDSTLSTTSSSQATVTEE